MFVSVYKGLYTYNNNNLDLYSAFLVHKDAE